MAKTKQGDPVEVTIVRGTISDGDGDHGPGETVLVASSDVERLVHAGIVRPANYVAPDEVQDGTLKISAADGPTVTSIGIA